MSGLFDSREYQAWYAMLKRCYNPKIKHYIHYGGRGIRVCERWHKFENFLKDMGPRPSLNLFSYSLDRIDNDGNYEPSNCRWASPKQQGANRRTNVYLEFKGRKMIISEWAKYLGFKDSCIRERLRHGWSIERTLSEMPSKSQKDRIWIE